MFKIVKEFCKFIAFLVCEMTKSSKSTDRICFRTGRKQSGKEKNDGYQHFLVSHLVFKSCFGVTKA